MKKAFLLFVALLSTALYAQLKQPIADPVEMARRFADSEMTRFPEAYQLDHGKRYFFGYAQGVGCCAMLQMWHETGERKYYDYVARWVDALVTQEGDIHKYDMATYNLDYINSGKTLFDVYAEARRHEEALGLKDTESTPLSSRRYKKAMDLLIKQLKQQPRTHDGGFWHKLIYQHQMWLDGIYMASPYMARYGAEFDKPEWQAQAVHQVMTCHKHTHDPKTGLYHHAWDESRNQRWADANGHSPNFWGRSIGWWFMAMVDVLDYIPADFAGRDSIVSYIAGLAESLPRYQVDGMWYQVLDCLKREGNYPEASVTTQCLYAYAKAVRKGYIDKKYIKVAQKAYDALQKHLLVENADGTLSLTRCCAVGGLGGNPYRDGSFEYYIGERIRDNDAKATGPFIMGCLELAKVQKMQKK